MKKILLFALPLTLFGSVEYQGNIGFEASYFDHDISKKRDSSTALRLEAELRKELENSGIVVKAKAIFDNNDQNRRYIDFNDFYYKYDFENSDFLIGKNTRFWGAMEFYNIADVFNEKDFLDNPFDYASKLGSWNVAYTHYLESSDISLILKLHEKRQRVQDDKSIYNFFPAIYSDDLQTQKSQNNPSIFLKYSGSGDNVQIDYSFIYQNGYDNQRYLAPDNGKLKQNAYLVTKLIGFASLVAGDTIYKSEVSYTISDDKKVSDYGQLGAGFEHTLYSFWDKADLGFLIEYYKYERADKSKHDFKNFFSNDLSIGFRLSMNDMSSSSLLGGLNEDLDSGDKFIFMKYDTRVYEKYKLEVTYQKLDDKIQSLSLITSYYF